MSTLTNAISEELPDHPPRRARPAASPASSAGGGRPRLGESDSGRQPSTGLDKGKQKATDTTQRNKVIAASVGAVVTSLTMTPFDVVKTRLQTQSDRSTRSNQKANWPPQASTSKAPYSYFAPSCESLMCRFDPRVSSASLPGGISHGSKQLPLAYYHAAAGPAVVSLPHHHHHHHHHQSHLSLDAPAAVNAPTAAKAARPPQFRGFWDAIITITRNEGLAAMWRGTGPALAMSVPGQIIYMVGYDWGKQALLRHAPAWAHSTTHAVNPMDHDRLSLHADKNGLKEWYSTSVPLVSGVVSRSLVVAVISPLELIRTRSQASTSTTSLASIIKGVKLSNAWTGLAPTLWRDVPFSGIYWVGYESIKSALLARSRSNSPDSGQGQATAANARSEFAVAFVSGATSGMIAATLTNPFDVVKTRRQADENASGKPVKGTVRMLRQIARREGPRALMAGLTPRLAKIGPACAIMVGCWEGTQRLLEEA